MVARSFSSGDFSAGSMPRLDGGSDTGALFSLSTIACESIDHRPRCPGRREQTHVSPPSRSPARGALRWPASPERAQAAVLVTPSAATGGHDRRDCRGNSEHDLHATSNKIRKRRCIAFAGYWSPCPPQPCAGKPRNMCRAAGCVGRVIKRLGSQGERDEILDAVHGQRRIYDEQHRRDRNQRDRPEESLERVIQYFGNGSSHSVSQRAAYRHRVLPARRSRRG